MESKKDLSVVDPIMSCLIKDEYKRQVDGLELIASENLTSKAVMESLGSCLTNKYSEGQPGRRYYGGNEVIDKVENLCKSRALQAYRLSPDEWHVNVQALSGSPANFCVMTGILKPGDRIMGLDLPCGGHLSHGYQTSKKKISAPAIYFDSNAYQTNSETGLLEYEKIAEHVLEVKPKLLICGGSAYPRDWDYKKFREMADSVGAYLLSDMAHISGLVLAEEHNDPFEYCDIVTTTTHKTMRGPRGALIFCKKPFAKQIDEAVFPGCQGGPHNNAIGGIAVALHEAMQPEFKEYIKLVKKNARILGVELQKMGYKLVTDGTENHLILWDLRDRGLTGSKMEIVCDMVGVTLNKNTVPGDKSALSPGGVRIGTPALTTRGFTEPDMKKLAIILDKLVNFAIDVQSKSPTKKLTDFNNTIREKEEFNNWIAEMKLEVKIWSSKFNMPGFE
tara:strand:- start:6222 stop:7565 length:1344 start_codon:yes stop_codon:yes gene_type:complete